MFDPSVPPLTEKTIDISEDVDLIRINLPNGKVVRIHKLSGQDGECRINWTGEMKILGSIVAN